MRRIERSRALLLAALLAACASPSAAPDAPADEQVALPALRDELLERMDRDQEVRSLDLESLSPADRQAALARFQRVDRENTAWLKTILAEHGWPTIDRVGPRASQAAWLLVQHADLDPDFQAEVLPTLQHLATEGQVSPADVAYLTDRVRVKQNRPQLYGTQYSARENPDGGFTLRPDGTPEVLLPIVEDPATLDARRQAAGLGPWSEYEAVMAEMQGREPASSPRAWNGELPVESSRHR